MRSFLLIAAALLATAVANTPAAAPAAAAAPSPAAAAVAQADSVAPAVSLPPAPKLDSDDLFKLYDKVKERVKEISDRERAEIENFAQDAINRIRTVAHNATAAVPSTKEGVSGQPPATPAEHAAAAAPAAGAAAPAAAPKAASFLELDASSFRMEAEAEADLSAEAETEAEAEEGADLDLDAEADMESEMEMEEEGAPAPAAKGKADAKKGGKGAAAKGKGKAVAKAIAKGAKKATAAVKKAVAPLAKGPSGLVIQPAPGQAEPAVTVRRRDEVGGGPAFARAVAGQHSWEEDLGALLSEVDESEAKAKALKLRIVEKENFLSSLDKRRALIETDIKADKDTIEVLSSHISAINSRVARLKKERVAQELMAQQSRYAAAAKKLSTEVDNIKSVSEALSSRITKIDAEAKPLLATETTEMRKSLGAAAAAAAPAPAAAAAAPAAAAAAPAAAAKPKFMEVDVEEAEEAEAVERSMLRHNRRA